jgi:AcrR family transcriptional regulator
MTNDVRERSREILRAELAAAASDFCAAHGFDSVTVDELARGIGVSRATFFRYFSSKEDALVSAVRDEHASLAQRVRAEAVPGDRGLAVVRRALEPTARSARTDPARLRARIAMISASPALRARLAADRGEQRLALADALSDYLADPALALALAVTANAAIELGWSLWTRDPDADLGDAFDRAFVLVAEASAAHLDPT